MRVWVLAVIGFVAGLACSLADELQGAACRSNADCDKSQTCVRTLHQVEQSDPIGTCSTSDACVVGGQAGCSCDADRTCSGAAGLLPVNHLEEEDINGAPLCFCCPTTCDVDQEPVISGLEVGTARCKCCPVCDTVDMQFRPTDEDGNVGDCGCRDEPESTGGSASSGSSG